MHTVTAPAHWKVVSNAASPQPEPLTVDGDGPAKAVEAYNAEIALGVEDRRRAGSPSVGRPSLEAS